MSRVGIIGGGSFGTALACVLRRSDHEVVIWTREPEVVADIDGSAVNPMFLMESLMALQLPHEAQDPR